MPRQGGFRILLVDDDPAAIAAMRRALEGVAELRYAMGGIDALRLAREAAPDLILLDAEMPGISGFETCQVLKTDPAFADIPVIFVTGHASPDAEVTGLRIGAADFIAKPINPPLLVARVQTQLRIKAMADELRQLTLTDALTRLANRRCFDDRLVAEWRRARRDAAPVALLLADVDHFKFYNDRHGHPSGDACLRAVAAALADVARRPGDLAARYGGEEFALLLPATDRDGAAAVARAAVDAVAALALPHGESPVAPHVTISAGLAIYDSRSRCWVASGEQGRAPAVTHAPGLARNADDFLRAADQALYAAKRCGRARAVRIDVADVDAVDEVATTLLADTAAA